MSNTAKKLTDFDKNFKHPVENAKRYILDAAYRKQIDSQAPHIGKELRQVAEQAGIVGEDTHARTRRLAGIREQPQKRYDATEHNSRERFPEDVIQKIWATQKVQLPTGETVSLIQFRKTHPSDANLLELSAWSHGLTPRKPDPIPVPEQPKEPATFELSSELCDRYNIQRGVHVSEADLFSLIQKFAAKQVAEKEAALQVATGAESNPKGSE